jgi:hypothetical protein
VRVSPTPESPGAQAPLRGLRLSLDILIAPARAFAEIPANPEWLLAYAIVVASGGIALALTLAAISHVVMVSPGLLDDVGKPAATIMADLQGFIYINIAEQVLSPMFTIGLTATVLTAIARYKGKDTSFRVYLSLAANCLIPTAIGILLSAAAVAIHPPASFADFRTLNIALPDNLAVFSAADNPRETAFLAHFDVFTLWSTILLAFGFTATTPVKFVTALLVTFGITLALAIFN